MRRLTLSPHIIGAITLHLLGVGLITPVRSGVQSPAAFDTPLAPLGERVAIPQSRESRVRGSPETMVARNYAAHDTSDWNSHDTLLISFSECDCQQEALLLMPEYGFVRTELGTFFLEPFALQPSTARLRMETSFGGTSCVTQEAPSN